MIFTKIIRHLSDRFPTGIKNALDKFLLVSKRAKFFPPLTYAIEHDNSFGTEVISMHFQTMKRNAVVFNRTATIIRNFCLSVNNFFLL